MAHYTTSGVGNAGAGNGASSIAENGVSFDGGNSVRSILKVGAGGNLRDGIVCLGTYPATVITSLAFSWFSSTVPTSLIAGQ